MQILIVLIPPFKVLLLYEITTSLDVCVRQDLMHWLIKESNERGTTILYDTYIFMNLMIGRHIFTTSQMSENVGDKARSETWRIIKN